MKDAQGLEMTAATTAAVTGYDHAIDGFLRYRADTPQRLKAALAADPEAPMLRIAQANFTLLGHQASALPRAADSLARAEATAGTERERAHCAALAAWVANDVTRAMQVWRRIVAEYPHDILAFRMHHFVAFWAGRPDWMLEAVAAVQPHWSAAIPGYPSILACRSFAAEECGLYTVAEAAGREAVALDPGDLWAAHAVAHVLEMQGRRGEGISWIASLEQHWEGGNNLAHHLWWHRALYHLERQEWPAVLALYDNRFRNLASPVTQAAPDLYIDVQNAASMLFRLGLHEVHVGDRWVELADKAEARIGDHLNPFTLPHWAMALAATRRWDAGARLLAALAADPAPLAHDVARRVCDAVLRHGHGDFAGAVAAMRPILTRMSLLGGSHAQQDVLEQLFLDSAVKAGLAEDARTLLERVAGSHPVPPARRVGYAQAAKEVRF